MMPYHKKTRSNYSMPPEWFPHQSTWCCFPFNDDIWHGKLKEVREEYAQFILTIARFESVNLFVNRLGDSFEVAHQYFKHIHNITLHRADMDDVWYRDNGPIFVHDKNQNIIPIKWNFNAWGEKYPYHKDNKLAFKTCEILKSDHVASDMVLEGGAVDVNGHGLALTTQQCLLNPNRNKNFSLEEIESYLFQYLGIEHCIWLHNGLANDHTDGHIDTIARFINKNTVLCTYTEDSTDENFLSMEENYKILNEASQKYHFNIVKIPLPQNKLFLNGLSLPSTYANFYMSQEFVIMPTYSDPNDSVALAILKSAFPKHEVVGSPSKHIISGGGSFHCLTQQQPKGELQ